MRTFPRIQRPIASVLLVVFACGCYTWSERTVDPATYITQEAPSQIRIHVAEPADTTEYWVGNPTIAGDSLRGSFTFVDRNQLRPLDTPGFPLAVVQSPFEVRQYSNSTTILVTLGTLAALGAAFAIWFTTTDWGS